MNRIPSIYLAGPWARREEMKGYKKQFEDAGIRVRARWIDLHIDKDQEKNPDVMRREAMNDIEDLLFSEILVVMNLEKSEGKAVETGIAIATCKGIILVGEPSNVFHYLDIPRTDSVEGAIEIVKNYPWDDEQGAELDLN